MGIQLIILVALLSGEANEDYPGPIVTYCYPKFGRPLVGREHIVFSGPQYSMKGSRRLICLSRNERKIVWEMEDDEIRLFPWFVMDDVVVITKEKDILSCDLKDKKTRLLYTTGLDKCRGIIPCGLPCVLLVGEKGKKDYLSLVDLKSGIKRWEIEPDTKRVTQNSEASKETAQKLAELKPDMVIAAQGD